MIPVSFAGRLAGQSLARLVLVLGALILGGVAAATPLDLKAIPADAVWLAHLDMDAARDSSVMQRGWERAVRMHPQLDGMLRMGAGMMGLNPRTDLRDVTLFGLDTDKRNGVMIVRAKCDRPLLEKMAAKAPDHATMQHRSYTLHSWTHKGWKKGTGEPVVGAFFSDDVMVFAATDARVRMALDVLDGTGPALGGDAALAGRTRPGSIVVARARAIAADTKCPVLREGRSYRVALGEHAGTSFYRARLEMASPEAAADAARVVAGMEAVGRLRYGREADVLKLISGLTSEVDGGTCSIAWNAPADDVWKVVDRAATTWEERARKRGNGCDGCGLTKGRATQRNADPPGADTPGTRPLRDDEF